MPVNKNSTVIDRLEALEAYPTSSNATPKLSLDGALEPMMHTDTNIARLAASLCCICALSATASAQIPAAPNSLMCVPGELLFSEDFSPTTVSDRWGFKADFALRKGALLRTDVNPTEVKRVFLKDPAFHNTIIQFDFKLSGRTTDLRLVTGSGGGYNSITQIFRQHFQLNTPVDRAAGIVPAHIGECIRNPRPDQWQTMTVEYWHDEMVAHLSDKEFVLGKHPIIDRTCTYFAFQFDLPGASIDNVRVWKATSQRDDWTKTRDRLSAVQANRAPVARDPAERYKLEYTKLKSKLTLEDQTYRELVAKHDKLKAALHADYTEAFVSHKQLNKQIAKKKLHIKKTIPEFKTLETAVHRARRAEDNYVLTTKPELANLKEDGIAKHRFPSELGQVRVQLEAAGDKQLTALVANTAEQQAKLESRFPEAFRNIDDAIEQRNAKRKLLNDDPDFQDRNRAVVDAHRAIKDYEHESNPKLSQYAADAKAYSDSLKTSSAK